MHTDVGKSLNSRAWSGETTAKQFPQTSFHQQGASQSRAKLLMLATATGVGNPSPRWFAKTSPAPPRWTPLSPLGVVCWEGVRAGTSPGSAGRTPSAAISVETYESKNVLGNQNPEGHQHWTADASRSSIRSGRENAFSLEDAVFPFPPSPERIKRLSLHGAPLSGCLDRPAHHCHMPKTFEVDPHPNPRSPLARTMSGRNLRMAVDCCVAGSASLGVGEMMAWEMYWETMSSTGITR